MDLREFCSLAVLTIAAVPAPAQAQTKSAFCQLQLGTDRFKHNHVVGALALSADGTRAASIGGNHTIPGNPIVLWDIESGKITAQMSVVAEPPNSIRFSPDGKLLASVAGLFSHGRDNSLHLWDAASGKLINSVAGPRLLPDDPAGGPAGGYRHVAFSADGKTLAAAAVDGSVRLWSMPDAKEIRRFATPVNAFAFSRDGTQLAVGYSSGLPAPKVRVFNVKTGEEVCVEANSARSISDVVFDACGKRVIVGFWDGTVRWLEVKGGKEIRRLNATVVASSPNGRFLVLREASDLVLWDLEKDAEQARFAKQVFLPAGLDSYRTLGGVSDNGEKIIWADFCTIKVLDTKAKKTLDSGVGHVGHVVFAQFSKDGRQIISAGDATIRTWDAKTGKQLGEHQAHEGIISHAAMTRDGNLLATGSRDGTVRFWEPWKKKEVFHIKVSEGSRPLVAFSPDGKTVAIKERYARDRGVRIWDVATQRELVQAGRGQGGQALAFLPHGRTLADLDSRVHFYDCTQGKLLAEFKEMGQHSGHDTGLAFSPDSRIAATAYWDPEHRDRPPRVATLWEVASGKMLARMTGHKAAIASLVFSSNGRLLVTGAWDGTVRLWDIASGAEIAKLEGHRGGVLSVAFSPDETRLVSAGSDTTLRVWDVSKFLREKRSQDVRLAEPHLETLWAKLGDVRADVAFKALWPLAGSPDDAVPFLSKRLLFPEPDQKRFEQLLTLLDNDKFPTRERATRDIISMGPSAAGLIQEALQSKPSAEVKRRLELALKKIESSTNEISGDHLRLRRAVQALEHIGNPQARATLEKLVRLVPTKELVQDVKDSLERLEKKKSR